MVASWPLLEKCSAYRLMSLVLWGRFRSSQIKPIQLHRLHPGLREIVNEALGAVVLGVHLHDGAELANTRSAWVALQRRLSLSRLRPSQTFAPLPGPQPVSMASKFMKKSVLGTHPLVQNTAWVLIRTFGLPDHAPGCPPAMESGLTNPTLS